MSDERQELERERDEMIALCAAGAAEIAKARQEAREYQVQIAELRERLLALDPLKEALHTAQQEITRLMSTTVVERELAATVDELRDQVRERDGVIEELRATLKRYTDVYADPDTPVDVSGFGVGEPDAPPLFPFMAEMADRVVASKPEPIAPQASVTVGVDYQVQRNAAAKRFNAEVLTSLAAATSELERLVCNARRALAAGYEPIEVLCEVSGLATHVARRVADGTLYGDVPQESDVVAFLCDIAPAPSKPEPAPVAGGELVTPRVLAWLATQAVNVGDEAVARAVALVRARDAFGRLKYEQGLSLGDGRDTVEDLKQELGDALQYGVKALIEGVEGERLEELRDLAQLLWLLMCADNVGGAR